MDWNRRGGGGGGGEGGSVSLKYKLKVLDSDKMRILCKHGTKVC